MNCLRRRNKGSGTAISLKFGRWATDIQAGDVTTETPFSDSGLSAAELTRLGRECSAIQLVGSGSGVCDCGHDGHL